ncbi:efflux RND transporter periplasmic adaptor subunit [Joostella atrarenae]|uniref:Efflux RND transporter periplasmic adaptor subunit n=1 Tax=Joostella atrarenae TaxID=679257 RepID=A0ABS9J404_9FLAO|nr:efflux RND transporter periplasmic adaptor subunit [Joostella atrarenae]MCF8715156.1 efflux RND transporter periplasmic adaptor subunit [Joostella atrarenae]
MKNILIKSIFFLGLIISFLSCSAEKKEESNGEGHNNSANEGAHGHAEEGHSEVLELSELKFNSLGIEVDSLSKKPLSGIVEANGELEVPPQYEATVTAIIGANVTEIKVIEGDKVQKGQVLAAITHPDLTRLQTDYIKAYSDMVFSKQNLDRQQKLYEAEVGSGKSFQQAQSEYKTLSGLVKGYESQLKHLNINPKGITDGNIVEEVSVVSPIDGYIEKVTVGIGQYVNPQDAMFMIVDNDHVHADLMVFERDVYKLKIGQEIDLRVQSIPNKVLKATIISIGKKFETSPKAIHVHADIDYEDENLIPGMYANGIISTSEEYVYALPEDAIVKEEGKSFVFTATKEQENGQFIWRFTPVEIKTGITHNGWVEIKLLSEVTNDMLFSYNNAYYLMAEKNKGETGHSH